MEVDRILEGDALKVLKTLPAECVDCVVTSPPYWQLRDYGVPGQLGLEPTHDEYIAKLCAVFDEVWRVLKPSGICWVNLSDSYSSKGARNAGFNERWNGSQFRTNKQSDTDQERPDRPKTSLPAKSLVLIPFRFAIEMLNRGWRVRNTLIWHKPNALPASIRDRFTVDFEYLFFFTKSANYYFEQQFEPYKAVTERRVRSFRKHRERFDANRHKVAETTREVTPFKILERICRKGLHPRGRNKRCVWSIGVRGFRGQHFATFPEKLIETPILAGCPKKGVVLDPFMGTGTTAMVARRLDRHFLGIELNPAYIRLARDRLKSD